LKINHFKDIIVQFNAKAISDICRRCHLFLCKIDKKRVNKNGCFLKAGAKIAGSVKKKPAR